MAGTGVDVALYPIDTIKTRLQSKEGFRAAGGFSGVYRGLSSAVIGSAPGAALFFTTYETAKSHLTPLLGGGPVTHMTAASLGEVAACCVRVPTEVMKQRLQTRQYDRLVDAARAAWKAEGIRAFFRGYGTTVMREIPFAFIQFPLYEAFKVRLAAVGDRSAPSSVEAAACGSVAGGIAAAITTPLDVAKTRIMLAEASAAGPPSTISTIRTIARDEGARALFAGIQPRVMWISIGGFVFFGIYEAAKRMLMRVADSEDDE
ncbi:carrier protein [Thecamonas trahens ATCC 50062]|uniref:Carrier protein n=1 Tax=Thecamonas trahens ATCC 50062 TaxID=461836 RepID=A0A0L0D9Q8_THETB|nr:carrier protein [Thecamonas trahens ATCC 50062]KNC48990.1 carrier protein [Thecamonas trahens ATCC 50062]|eukprot:XP_013758403.1 carrier protein [Thecamonas trahens ATCC 50062]